MADLEASSRPAPSPVFRYGRRLFALLFLAAAAAFLLITYRHHARRASLTASAKALAQSEVDRAVNEIGARLQHLEALGRIFCEELAKNAYPTRETLEAHLVELKKAEPDLYGIGVAWAPYAFEPKTRLYSPYYCNRGGVDQLVRTEEVYDYTEPGREWYSLPFEKGAIWIDPYYGEAGQAMMAEYSVPVPDGAGGTRGVVSVSLALDRIQELVKNLKLGRTGYGVLYTSKGTLLTHPVRDYVKEERNFFALTAEEANPALDALVRRAAEAKAGGMVEHVNPQTDQASWIYCQPVPEIDWVLKITFIKDEFLDPPYVERQSYILIILCAVAALVFGIVAALGGAGWTERELWILASLVSIVCAGGIGAIWSVSRDRADMDESEILLLDETGLTEFLSDQESLARRAKLEAPAHIRTGVYLENVDFNTDFDTSCSGFIWQKRPAEGLPEGIRPGFILPQVGATWSEEVEEAFETTEGETTAQAWRFKAVLNDDFDYSKFPFDHKIVRLRLLPKDFYRNVLLVPDLAGYALTIPSALPGVASDFFIPGWNLQESYFSYRLQDYNTNFGVKGFVGQDNRPELQFNIVLQRNFLSPFISHLVPISVVVVMLFITLLLNSLLDDRDILGFTVMDVLASTGALFFVLIVSHIDLRSAMDTPEVLYLEYFYFVLYIAILAVTLNSILFIKGRRVPFIHDNNNLLPKLAFWPLILGALFVITAIVFY